MYRRLLASLAMASVVVLVAIAVTRAISADAAGTAAAYESSPYTSSPSESDVPSDGRCVKGRSECRWGGDCAQRGNKCYSCIDGLKYQDGLGCYSCIQGTSLVRKPDGRWVCSDGK